ncbi:hypothetical protein HNP02_003838 [Mycobacterium sp. AZCC_0083]|nr:hypothetical protein [Mycobacterium sp. AZCC_0083]
MRITAVPVDIGVAVQAVFSAPIAGHGDFC